jgi:hypothetical protein
MNRKEKALKILEEKRLKDLEACSDFFYDDITFCCRECSNTECFRNRKNMKCKEGLHSFADFFGEMKNEVCPKDASLPDNWKEIFNK